MLIGLGVALILIGLLFCLTIIGAIIGIPMILAGVSLCFWGLVLGRKTVIQNVVTVTNAPQAAPAYAPPQLAAQPEQGRIQTAPMQQIPDGSPPRIQ
jgi:hypothetical protein